MNKFHNATGDISGISNITELFNNSSVKKWIKLISVDKTILFDEYNRKEYFTKVADIVLDKEVNITVNIEILGKDTTVKAQTYHAYESAFIKYYEQNYNEKPILCCNSDPDY